MSQHTSRRDFLKASAGTVAAGWWVANSQFSFGKENSPNERIQFACIGVGGKGSSDTDSAGNAGDVVALCDIDEGRLNGKAAKYKDAAKYNDFRKMLEEIGDKIDAVTVSTPDHTHAVASVMAMKLGKHCFTQKPLTWSIGEARIMRELAAEKKLCTQMGNQGTATAGLRESVDIIRSGAIGDVTEVHVWTNRPIWPQGTGRPEPQDVPQGVNWDLFLGPAPERPYSSAYHPFKWRGWLDFGTGALGDMACHTMNMPVMALDLFEPISVEAVENAGIVENETYPKYSVLKYEFPKTDKRGPVVMYWYDGGKLPPLDLFHGANRESSGALVVGKKGTLLSLGDYGGGFQLLPKDKFQDFTKPEPVLPRSPGHFEEFAAAIKANDASLAMSNFGYAGRLTETVLLGNLALRLPGKVEWDAKNMVVTNAEDKEAAKALILRPYREGWSL